MDFETIEVLWHGKIRRFVDYGEALEYAKTMTFEEEKYDTALVISIKEDDTARIDGVHWISGGMFVMEKLTF